MTKLKINEVFESLQGEGSQAGMKVVFVRLAGCNLTCSFCDTKHEKVNYELTANELLKKINSFDCNEIVLTGGEPTTQEVALIEFCKLASPFKRISIETNGTNWKLLKKLKDYGILSFITVSPKSKCTTDLQQSVDLASEVKFVYTAERIWETYLLPFYSGKVWIQPCSEDFKPAIQYVMENPQFRLSVQIQKVINIQ